MTLGIRIFLFTIGLLLTTVLTIYVVNRGPEFKPAALNVASSIKKDAGGKFTFYRNGAPFKVKGTAGYSHLSQLAAMGGNTVSWWDTAALEKTLDEAAKNNIAVIVGLDIPGGENVSFYQNKRNVDRIFTAYNKIVERYKQHPALLAWCLGNELIMPFTVRASPFYDAYNRLLLMIRTTDPDHTISTSVINVAKRNILNIRWRIPSLDFICINTYAAIKVLDRDLATISLFWDGPYLLTEWAPQGGWEAPTTIWNAPIENTSTKKAEQYREYYQKYMPTRDDRFLGSLAFFWGNRHEYTYTWYSVFNDDGAATEMTEALRDCWNETETKHQAPRVKYALIDSLGSYTNLILTSKSVHRASLLMENPAPAGEIYRYKWEILKDDWMTWGRTWNNNFKKPMAEPNRFADSTQQFTHFTAPLQEGPYRVFVTVYDSKGFCGTANAPIYVVE